MEDLVVSQWCDVAFQYVCLACCWQASVYMFALLAVSRPGDMFSPRSLITSPS